MLVARSGNLIEVWELADTKWEGSRLRDVVMRLPGTGKYSWELMDGKPGAEAEDSSGDRLD